MLKHILPIILCLGFSYVTTAQKATITGRVFNEREEPLPFASVVVKGTTTGVQADINGLYTLEVQEIKDLVIVFSMVGYTAKEVIVAGRTKINATLSPDNQLGDVVVVGYGKTTTRELTGATSKIQGKDLEKMNLARVDQALQGQVAGVNISTNSGSPGGSSNIRIRGLTTFGDNDPLILVDGVIYDSEGLNALNPSDIKSVNVLKDATAGIYGVRAANGVILIETKSGRLNAKPEIEYNGYWGIQQTANKLNLLNAQEYAVIKNEMFAFGGDDIPFTNTQLGVGTNWQDTIFQTAPIQSHNISMTGGSESSRYSIGLGYFTQDGIVGGPKASFDRYNARLNFSTELAPKLRLNSIFLFSRDSRSGLPENGIGSVLYNTINAFPTSPVQTANGNYSYLDEVNDIINPVAQIENTYNATWANKFVGKQELVLELSDNLSFTNRFNYNYAIVDAKVFSPLVWYGSGKFANTAVNEELDAPQVEIAEGVFLERGASVYEERSTFTDLTFESFLNYDRSFEDIHRVKGTAGLSLFHRQGMNLNATAFGIPNNSEDFADISANTAEGGFLNNAGSWEYSERLLSTFVRAEYGYKFRYLISGILRLDGSSKFGPNSRYGVFPTISGAWLASDEDFFDVRQIDFLKVRLSYGVSGNDQIPNFAHRALLNGEGVYVFDDLITVGSAIGRGSNPDLKWETTRQFNAGVDMSLLKSLDVTTNFFIKNTRDLLFQPDVSGILGTYGPGGFPPVINAGDVRNVGVELELGYGTNPDRDLVADIAYNVTYIHNEVTSVPEGVDFLPGANFGVGGNVATRFEQGFPIGYFHGFETAGIFQTQEEIDTHPVSQDGAKPGDLIFVDQNGDGEINFSDDSDKTIIGSPIPDFTMGFALTLNYRGFDLTTNLYAALGQEIIRNFERQQPYANQLDYVLGRWTGPGSTNEHPRLTTDQTRNTVFSDYYVENGSFARLRSLQLGYTFPRQWTDKLHVKSMRVYLAANNLFTLTTYQGFDPDVGSTWALSGAVDYGQYPQARTFMGGAIIKF